MGAPPCAVPCHMGLRGLQVATLASQRHPTPRSSPRVPLPSQAWRTATRCMPLLALCTDAPTPPASPTRRTRLAFYGRLVSLVDPSKPEELSRLRLFKVKQKQGAVERVQPDGNTAIVRSLIKKESDVAVFTGLKVRGGGGVHTVERSVWR